MSQKPNVIVFGLSNLLIRANRPSSSHVFSLGGLNTLSRALVSHLVPLQGEPLVNVS